MSIRVDTQMMVVKSAELVRDADAVYKKSQLIHDFQAVQNRLLDEHRKKKVLETEKTDKIYLRAQDDPKGSFAAYETPDENSDGYEGSDPDVPDESAEAEDDQDIKLRIMISKIHNLDIKL